MASVTSAASEAKIVTPSGTFGSSLAGAEGTAAVAPPPKSNKFAPADAGSRCMPAPAKPSIGSTPTSIALSAADESPSGEGATGGGFHAGLFISTSTRRASRRHASHRPLRHPRANSVNRPQVEGGLFSTPTTASGDRKTSSAPVKAKKDRKIPQAGNQWTSSGVTGGNPSLGAIAEAAKLAARAEVVKGAATGGGVAVSA